VCIQGREILATLANLVIEDNHIFLLFCVYLMTGCMLTYTTKEAKKRQDRDLASLTLHMTCRYAAALLDVKYGTHRSQNPQIS
jgi:hypothetical protein